MHSDTIDTYLSPPLGIVQLNYMQCALLALLHPSLSPLAMYSPHENIPILSQYYLTIVQNITLYQYCQ